MKLNVISIIIAVLFCIDTSLQPATSKKRLRENDANEDLKTSDRGAAVAGQKKYACIFCSYTTDHSQHFTLHEATHTGLKPHACDYEGCDYKSARAYDLSMHKRRVHEKNKPFSCDYEGCHYCGPSVGDITKHKKDTHKLGLLNRVREFVCRFDGCSFRADKEWVLQRHQRVRGHVFGQGTHAPATSGSSLGVVSSVEDARVLTNIRSDFLLSYRDDVEIDPLPTVEDTEGLGSGFVADLGMVGGQTACDAGQLAALGLVLPDRYLGAPCLGDDLGGGFSVASSNQEQLAIVDRRSDSLKLDSVGRQALDEDGGPAIAVAKQQLLCRVCRELFPDRASKYLHERSHTGVNWFPCPSCDYVSNHLWVLKKHQKQHALQGQEFSAAHKPSKRQFIPRSPAQAAEGAFSGLAGVQARVDSQQEAGDARRGAAGSHWTSARAYSPLSLAGHDEDDFSWLFTLDGEDLTLLGSLGELG